MVFRVTGTISGHEIHSAKTKMPHPSDFDRYIPATTDEGRKRFWACVPEETMIATIRARVADHGAAPWLRSLMDMGGLCFPRNYPSKTNSPLPKSRSLDEGFVEGNFQRIDAVARMANLAHLREITAGLADGESTNVLTLASVSDEWRSFHSDFCSMLVQDDIAWREEAIKKGASDCQVDESNHALQVESTLAVALATACILNDAKSVSLIAKHNENTMEFMIDIGVMGDWGRMGVVSDSSPPKVTPYFCAMQFSSADAMDALVDAGLDPSFAMGMDPRKKGLHASRKPFDVLSLGKVIVPMCEPEVYEKAIHQRLAAASKSDVQKFAKASLDLLATPEDESSVVLRYLPSLIKAGAFDSDPNAAAKQACSYGYPTVLQHVAPHVQWRLQFPFSEEESPLMTGSKNAFSSVRMDKYDAAFELFVKNACTHGFGDRCLKQTSQLLMGTSEARQVPQPIHNLIMMQATLTINALLRHGLKPNKRMDPDTESPMEVAVRSNTGIDNLMRSAVARNVANAAMETMDQEMAHSRKGGIAP